MTVQELRKKYQLSQAALAKAVGVSTSAIGAIEAGRMKVSAKIADAIKNVYDEAVELEAKAKETKASGRKSKTAAKESKEKAAKKAKAVKEKAAQKKDAKQAVQKKTEILIQSPMGGEITPETVLEKVGKVDKVYIRVDENKAYWVKGEESGAVELWD